MTEPDEPFDPTTYPEEFTAEIFRELPMRDLIEVEQHLDEMSPRQQETFKTSREEIMGPIRDKFQEAFEKSAAAKIMRTSFQPVKSKAWTQQSPAIEQMRRSAREIAARAQKNEQIIANLRPRVDVPRPDVAERVDELRIPTGLNTVDDLEREMDRDAEMLSVLNGMFELQQRQHLTTTRGWFFGVVVSMSVVVAGVAPIVSAESSSERWWIVGISTLVGAVAFLVYLVVRRQQKRADTPPAQPGLVDEDA